MKPPPDLSRRDFLKLSSAGLLGLFLAELRFDQARASAAGQVRAAFSGIQLFEEPSFKANPFDIFNRDAVLNVTGQKDGDFGFGNPYNKTWFKINGGYAYSGYFQPVETNYQEPVYQIPAAGQLGEITVPLSDARVDSTYWADHAYRLYYRTTHWVTEVAVNKYEKTIWYKIYDKHLDQSFYVSAQDMRLVPDSELTPLSSDVPDQDKHIYVDTDAQLVTAFEEDRPVLIARCSSGGKGTRTPPGDYQTFHKGPTIHMTNDGAPGAGRGYDLPGVPWVSFFTGTGISFHGTYWHNDYGRPRSHGCVNLSPDDAKFIYRWTSPLVPPGTAYLYEPGSGTKVEVVSANS
ncbi:MAG TPA: L,D-transpeptidase family protein [Anaerolineales bacterium]|nr:L,D-transpeptidase family protein [Anaerolineales bacterium]